MKRKFLLPFFALIIVIVAGMWYGISSRYNQSVTYDTGFNDYLSAYTAGEISRTSAIRIRFAYDIANPDRVGEPLEKSPFVFSPSISGKTVWTDTRTLEFQPDNPLPSGTIYRGDLDMRQIIREIPSNLGNFPFRFASRRQNMAVNLTSIRPLGQADQRWQQISGVVKTVDFAPDENVEKLLEAAVKGKPLSIRWAHKGSKNEHTFFIDSLERKENAYEVALTWSGKKIEADTRGNKAIPVPALGSFYPVQTYTFNRPDPYIVLEFSNPVKKDQDLNGMISLRDIPLRFSIEANRIRVYPGKQISGPVEIKAEPGILGEENEKLNIPFRENIIFSEVKPEVRLIGQGTILPRSENSLPLVFEAIGLKAIDVRVIKIFEKNVPQFLQVNQLDGNREMKRVGQMVAKKRIELDKNTELDLNTWNRHSLDMSSLIQSDPGAIYEVSLGFRKSYAYFTCDEDAQDKDKDMLELEEGWFTYVDESEDSYWDYYYDDYEDREDPCKQAYYNTDRIIRRNILASDLGLIAKQGSQGAFFAVTNLKTTQPVSGAKLEVYDYQHQLITTATTDDKGMVRAQFERTPFLMVAKVGEQRGYLRLDDGSALSMSRFDTQGKKYQKGVKGFIYGERGVWRPGDPIYLTFMLEDKEKSLPAGHPVVFELLDPHGQVVEKMVRTEGNGGFYPFPTATAPDAPTGNYLARVKVGGSVFTQSIKVETIVPNRLKMQLDFGVPFLSRQTAGREADLKVQWLHGAIAKNLKADVKVTLQDAPLSFAKYSAYNFTDPVRKFDSEEKTLFDGSLNELGIAKIPAKITVNSDAPGMLVANFKGKVFEPGGGFSVDRFSMPFHPYDTYVGIKTPKGDAARGMLLTDTDHNVEIATVDKEGRPVSGEVEVKLYKLEWKWWWDKSEDNIGTYQGKVNASELQSAKIRTVNGAAIWKLNVKYPDWGRYLVRVTDKNGHATGKIIYIDWPGWAGRSTDNERGGAQMLNFTTDKETYAVGETINLSIPSGGQGRALVSVETGNKILQAHWVDAVNGTTRFAIPASGEMAPNVYIHVTLLQPHAQTANDRPIRLYGVVPVKVEDPATHLNPVIAMPDQLEPASRYAVKVSEKNSRAMTYTLAVVDEGLLGLTRFETPSPWQTFYQREALDVRTWDIYDHVLGAFGGEIKSMLSIGGGADSDGPEGKKPDRFKPVVKFLGPFELKAGETQTHHIDMPNYVGEVRTMVVAGSPSGAYGSAEKSTPVKKPLMVLGSLPRVLGPGEQVLLPVTVFALEDNIREVNVRVQTGKQMLVEESETQSLRFSETGEKMAYFKLTVLNTLGKGTVKISAQSGGQTAVYETDIEIRTPIRG
ncbi:MAG: MG2 domain-containing protein [Bacteroidia bacterium]